jgi:hypothetical protein
MYTVTVRLPLWDTKSGRNETHTITGTTRQEIAQKCGQLKLDRTEGYLYDDEVTAINDWVNAKTETYDGLKYILYVIEWAEKQAKKAIKIL